MTDATEPRRLPAPGPAGTTSHQSEPWSATSSAACCGWSCCCSWSARSRSSSSTRCRRPTRPRCAPAASRTRSWSSRSATTSGSTSRWYEQYFDYMKNLVTALRLRLQLPEQHLGHASRSSTACRRRSRSRSARPCCGWRRHPVGIISADPDRAACSTASRWARRWSRSRRRSTGSASSSLYLFADDIGKFPALPGRRHLRPVQPGPGAVVRVADHAVVRARGRVRRVLRAAAARAT